MELEELKKAWGKVSDDTDQNHLVNADEIRVMLHRRGTGILSKLERNVRTGFWLVGIFVLLAVADQYFPYDIFFPSYLVEQLPTPFVIEIFGIIVNVTIVLSFIHFVIQYQRLNVRSLAADNIHVALSKVIQLLDTFKKEFYLALIVFSFAESIGFMMGVWQGFKAISDVETMSTFKIIQIGIPILAVMATIISLIFYIFHKGFNSLYGRYRQQLIGTLNELEETEE